MKTDWSNEELDKLCEIIGYPDAPDKMIFACAVEGLFHLCAKDYVKFRKYMKAAIVLTEDRP